MAAVVHSKCDEAKVTALEQSGAVHDGFTINVTGHSNRYVSNTMDILRVNTDIWSKHWKAGDAELNQSKDQTFGEADKQLRRLADTAESKAFAPDQIRKAAKRFKSNTSIGADCWSLLEIIRMPNVILQGLGQLLSDIQFMATLPKKDWGTRTVAIASTLYRLLVELDNDEVARPEAEHAYEYDSAKAGSSALYAVEDRALETVVASMERKHVVVVLWDLVKFFDTIDIATLFGEAARVGFPSRQLLLSVIVHHGPRRLKLRRAVGESVGSLGRSIYAGCKRSTHLARV